MSSICLSEVELLSFAQGKLDRESARVARAHVDACVPCGSRLLAMGNGYGHADPSVSQCDTKPESVGNGALPAPVPPPLRSALQALPDEMEGEDAWENLPAALLPGAVLAETYHVGRRIGVGGMGQVYEATHARLAGRYAVKVLHPRYATDRKALTRFRREAMIASGLRHPNIVQIIDFQNTADGTPFLVMEYLDGQDLAKALSDGPLSLERTVAIIDQVAAALTAVHRHGIVHRDLKPQNVFLIEGDYPGRELVKVVDFGISKVRTATSGLTLEQLLVGTPEYMAPEQAIGDVDHIAPATDQFALAAIAYEMLTGQAAFVANTLAVAVFQVVNKEPRSMRELIPDLPASVEEVVRRGLSKKAGDRFPSIAAFAEALRAAAQAAPVAQESSDPPQERPLPSGLSRSLLMGAAAGATVLVGILVLSGLRPERAARPQRASTPEEEQTLRERATSGGAATAAADPLHTSPSPGTATMPAGAATPAPATSAAAPPAGAARVPAVAAEVASPSLVGAALAPRKGEAPMLPGRSPSPPSDRAEAVTEPSENAEAKPSPRPSPKIAPVAARALAPELPALRGSESSFKPAAARLKARRTPAALRQEAAPSTAVPPDTLLGVPVPSAPAQGTLIEKLD